MKARHFSNDSSLMACSIWHAFLFGDLGLDADRLRQELAQHAVAPEYLGAVRVAVFGQRDIPVIRLVDQALFFQGRDGFVDRGFRDPKLVRYVDGSHGHVRRAA